MKIKDVGKDEKRKSVARSVDSENILVVDLPPDDEFNLLEDTEIYTSPETYMHFINNFESWKKNYYLHKEETELLDRAL